MKNTPAPHLTLELLRKSCVLTTLLSLGLMGCGAVNTLETPPAPKPVVTPVTPAPQPAQPETPAKPETPTKPTPPVADPQPNPTPPTPPDPAPTPPPVTTPPAPPIPVTPTPVTPTPVTPAPLPQPVLNLTPSNITLTAGGSSQVFKATLTNSSEALNWTLTPNVGTLSSSTGSNVTYSPPSSVAAPTTVTLRVTGAGLEQTAQIVLNPAPIPPAPQPTLSLTPLSITLIAGGSSQGFQASLTNSSAALTWSLSPNLGSLSSSAGNNVTYTPPSSVSVQTTVTLKVAGAGLEQTSQIVISPAPTPPIIIVNDAQKMLAAINAVRAQGRMCGATSYAAVPALTWNTKLEAAAYLHSKDMAERNYFAHDTLEGVSPWDRMKAQGYSFRAAGENIAAGQMTLEVVIKGWVDSPGHCQNLMSADFTEVGMGRFDSAASSYKVYWTQDFGKPL